MLFDLITNAVVIAIAANCRLLKVLLLGGLRCVTDATFIALANGCTHLTTLDVSESEVTDIGLAYLVTNCPALTNITAHGCARLTKCGVEHCGMLLKTVAIKFSARN